MAVALCDLFKGLIGYNTHPGASLCIFPIPFEGTDPRNRIGRRTVMPMCSGASWQKFGATKTVEETLAAKAEAAKADAAKVRRIVIDFRMWIGFIAYQV